MESIKRFLTSKKKKKGNNPKSDQPVDGSYKKVTPEGSPTPRVSARRRRGGNYCAGNATTSFIPQDRGRKETLNWLNIGASDAIESLLTERDRAEKQVRRGPMTKGTSEVQLILNEPSCKSIEKLHDVQQRSEITARYGVSGTVAYNFSKSLGWNIARMARVRSLQLRDFGTGMRHIRTTRMPAVPFSPINWLVIPTSTLRQLSSYGHGKEPEEPDPSPICEQEIWRDSNQVDIADLRPSFTYEIPLSKNEWLSVTGEEEGEEEERECEHDSENATVESTIPLEGEATAVKITPVSRQHIREIRVSVNSH
ncbi:hypothetical protein F5X97DRAFT_330441 [Nemania serpens]|nr:hypothetical protein F5X97DRAFT_330441 [Nemania serpens]